MAVTQNTECWESEEAVKEWVADLWLFRGEQLAFDALGNKGLRGKRVLDLACGGGRTTHFLNQKEADVIGVDISQNIIGAAKEKFPKLKFQVGDAASLDFENDSFDVVLISFCSLGLLYPLEKREQAIQEVFRVLRPGGRLIFSGHNLSGLFFSWYNGLRPSKLLFRLAHILNGDAFKDSCFIITSDYGGVHQFFAKPNYIIKSFTERGFQYESIYPNCPFLGWFQRIFKGRWFTKLAEPWPYYVFKKG